MQLDQQRKSYCNRCGEITHHDLLAFEHQQSSGGPDEMRWDDRFEFLRCRGCHSVSMLNTFRGEDSDDEEVVTRFPPAIARREPRWMTELHFATGIFDFNENRSTVHVLLQEIYIALQNNTRSLAGMGIRALLDRVIVDKVGDKGSFAANVGAFKEAGYLSSHQQRILTTIIDAGHATTHRGWRPSIDDLNTLLDVAESIVEQVYLHDKKAARLSKKVPPRAGSDGTD
jgi:hypothetical protein